MSKIPYRDEWPGGEGETNYAVLPTPGPCIWTPCVATWEHYHGGFPGGYDDPDDPEGTPIPFTGPDPDPTAVRDYNGAALRDKAR